MDVIADFEAVIREVREARPVPFSASAIVDRKALLERLEVLLEAVPGELKKARWIIEDREEVLARIQREAQETLERARRERDRMLCRAEIDRAASAEAERVIDTAKAQAREIRLEAEHFVDGKLASLEVGLQKMLALVQSASTSFTDVSGPPPRLSAAPKRAVSARLTLEPDDDQDEMRPSDPLEVPHMEARSVQPPVVVEHSPVVEPPPSVVAEPPLPELPPAVQRRPSAVADLPAPGERPPAVQRRPAPVAERPPVAERRPSPGSSSRSSLAPTSRTQAPGAKKDRSRAQGSQAPRGAERVTPPPAARSGAEPAPPRLEPRKREEPAGGSAVRTLGLGSPPRTLSAPPRPSPARQAPPRPADPAGGFPPPAGEPPPAPEARPDPSGAASAPGPRTSSDWGATRPRARARRQVEVVPPPPEAPPERQGDRPGERVAESERTGTVRVIRTRPPQEDVAHRVRSEEEERWREADPPDSLF